MGAYTIGYAIWTRFCPRTAREGLAMKFVSVRELRARTAAIRRELDEHHDIVLTTNGRPFAILSGADPENLEQQLLALRRARARLALDRVRARAKASGSATLSAAEIDKEVADSRRGRRP